MPRPTRAIKTVGDYIAAFPVPVRKRLSQIRSLIKKLVPEAEERLSYGMPAFFLNKVLVYFAAHKAHIGFYPGLEAVVRFDSRLTRYQHAKGSIRFPHGMPLPIPLIKSIVKFRAGLLKKKKKGKKN